MNIKWLAGWLPAIVLPASTLLQIIKIIETKSATNVSGLSWFLFGLANIGAYIFSGKYKSIQFILAFLLTTILDFFIVTLVWYY